MSLWRQVRHGLRSLFRSQAVDRDVDDEIGHYLDEAAAEYRRQGMAPEAARRAARVDLGSAAAVRQEVRGAGWESGLAAFAADVRHTGRILRRAPLFTAVAILVIAAGSGAVTTIYSALNAIVLRPLPGTSMPDRLVSIDRHRPGTDDGIQASHNYAQFLRRESAGMTGIGTWSKVTLAIGTNGPAVVAYGNLVSGNYFDVLGVRPALGRFFRDDEDDVPLAHPVVVVSHAFWRTRFGADSAAVGGRVLVNGHPHVLIGVAPPEFRGVFTPIVTDAWVPLAMQQVLRPQRDLGHASWLWTFGRLADGVSPDAAAAELGALTARYAAAGIEPASRREHTAVRLAPLNGLPADARRMAFGFIGILFAAASLVLLIAGVNVASMLSARAIARRREMAVRAALGAGRSRLVRQLLTEILVLFTAGAGAGFLVAAAAARGLDGITIPADVPIVIEATPDMRVFAFAVLVTLAAGLVFGLVPAVRGAGGNLTDRLREGTPAAGTRGGRGGRVLIAGQLALSLVLLVSAGLFLRALGRGALTDPGFEVAGVTVSTVNPESWGYSPEQSRAFYRDLAGRLAAIPGVTAVTAAYSIPLAFATADGRVEIGERSADPGETAGTPIQLGLIGPGYFDVLRMPLVSGRPIGAEDDETAPRVAVVNETFARRAWPGLDPLGRTFRYLDEPVTVVGLVRDAKYGSLAETTPAFAYFPLAQRWQPNQVLMLRSAPDAPAPGPAILAAIRAIDPLAPAPWIRPLAEASSIVLLPQRIAAVVTGSLGLLGLCLAAVGLYGTISFSVQRRTREIGLRAALGADRPAVVRMVVLEGLRLAGAGVVAGLLVAAVVGRVLAGLLFGLSPLDPATLITVSVLLLGAAALASWLPARRAAAADPMAALRTD